jgi:hypothetical protein
LFEGVFGRAFRANVQPVELARKLAEEMDDHRKASVTRVYVPNEYKLYLSPQDRAQFSSYEEALRSELEEYLSEHARREHYALPAPPKVFIDTDAELKIGEFGIAARMSRGVPGEPAEPPAPAPALAPPLVLQETHAFNDPALLEPKHFALMLGERRYPLESRALVIGRARDCDIHLPDPNASRRHAEVRPDGDDYLLADLGSTNGTELNGQRVGQARLSSGDRILIGQTELTFTQE